MSISLADLRFQCQSGRHVLHHQGLTQSLAPGLAFRRRFTCRQACDAPGRFQQRATKHLPLPPQTGALKHGASNEQVVRRIQSQIVRPRHESGQSAAPVHRGFEAGHETRVYLLRTCISQPCQTRDADQLNIRNKHDCMGRMYGA